MIDRIQQIQDAAADAVARAGSSDELERLRIEYLGRKAELPQLLRGVAELPPEERGKVGKAANQARGAIEALIGRRREEVDRKMLADIAVRDAETFRRFAESAREASSA